MAKKLVSHDELCEAAQLIKTGHLVAFPTETVYGLGANGLDAIAVRNIFAAKGRPADNPLILHISNFQQLSLLIRDITPLAKKLIDEFWPGPLTIVLPASELVPAEVTGGLDTVAVRMPKNEIALQLIRLAEVPIAAPSANKSGRPSPTSAAMVKDDLAEHCSMIIDGGNCQEGLESTVVDCRDEFAVVLRPGTITREMLENVVGKTYTAEDLPNLKRHSPGTRYRHYAPKATLKLMEQDTICNNGELYNSYKKIGLIISSETSEMLSNKNILTVIFGNKSNMRQYAAGLYAALRFFDDKEIDEIWAEKVAEIGLGTAIMNRLRRAAEEV